MGSSNQGSGAKGFLNLQLPTLTYFKSMNQNWPVIISNHQDPQWLTVKRCLFDVVTTVPGWCSWSPPSTAPKILNIVGQATSIHRDCYVMPRYVIQLRVALWETKNPKNHHKDIDKMIKMMRNDDKWMTFLCSLDVGEIRTQIPDAQGAAATKTPGVAGASWIFEIVHPVWRSTWVHHRC